jgi:4-amino-4-deoxy-L-arabinose transferase-like glycosyltransferase
MYHWQGWEVDAKEYALPHLASENRDWLPTDSESYEYVFGSRHYLYQIYVGTIYWLTGPDQLTVILSNAVPLAATAPAVYCASNLLFENNTLAALAASLTLVDPSFSAAGAFVMRDALVVFLVAITLWATVLVSQGRVSHYRSIITLVAALLGLIVLRQHVALAFGLAAVLVMFFAYERGRTTRLLLVLALTFLGSIILYSSFSLQSVFTGVAFLVVAVLVVFFVRNRGRTKRLLLVLALSFLVFSVIVAALYAPVLYRQGAEEIRNVAQAAGSVLSANQLAVQGAVETLLTSSNESSESQDDQAVHSWIQTLREDPLLAITKTVAHTLFAPYPWVPFLEGGLHYQNSVELYYPAVVLWIIGLPFLIVALWRLPLRESPELLLIMLWLLLIVLEYIVVYGEFSTRQRVFMMPLLWILIAFGVEQVRAYFDKTKTSEQVD